MLRVFTRVFCLFFFFFGDLLKNQCAVVSQTFFFFFFFFLLSRQDLFPLIFVRASLVDAACIDPWESPPSLSPYSPFPTTLLLLSK